VAGTAASASATAQWERKVIISLILLERMIDLLELWDICEYGSRFICIMPMFFGLYLEQKLLSVDEFFNDEPF